LLSTNTSKSLATSVQFWRVGLFFDCGFLTYYWHLICIKYKPQCSRVIQWFVYRHIDLILCYPTAENVTVWNNISIYYSLLLLFFLNSLRRVFSVTHLKIYMKYTTEFKLYDFSENNLTASDFWSVDQQLPFLTV